MHSTVIPKIASKSGLQNKPQESKWIQQNLPSYRPQYSFICSISFIICIGIGCLVMTLVIMINLNTMEEISIDYTDCYKENISKIIEKDEKYILSYHKTTFDEYNNTICTFRFELLKEIKGNIIFQYSLHKFYQNWKSYFDDRSDYQLEGHPQSIDGCKKFKIDQKTQLPIAPCGSIANTMFNDTFKLLIFDNQNYLYQIPWDAEDIIWSIDKKKKFKNPKIKKGQTLCDAFSNTTKPPNWRTEICKLGNNDTGYGFQNVDFIIWMKSAALPKFRKNYRSLIQKDKMFKNGLPIGLYQLDINYSYNVESYNATKRFIITTSGLLPSKNNFLYKAYAVITGFLFGSAIIFGILDFINKKII
uniref:Cell cycle control protein 50A n=1 Tax=Strongyloides stercoralis TaxID=6248 RepID=A0A0K0ENE6_STRER